jgi:hypothetical protein
MGVIGHLKLYPKSEKDLQSVKMLHYLKKHQITRVGGAPIGVNKIPLCEFSTSGLSLNRSTDRTLLRRKSLLSAFISFFFLFHAESVKRRFRLQLHEVAATAILA